jgi:hypothetical protein
MSPQGTKPAAETKIGNATIDIITKRKITEIKSDLYILT